MGEASLPMVAIRATRLIDAGYVRIDAGQVAEVRAGDAPALLACGAAEMAEPPAPTTLPGGATPDSAGASPVDAAEAGDAAEALGEAAPSQPATGEVPGGASPDTGAAAAPATRKGRRA